MRAARMRAKTTSISRWVRTSTTPAIGRRESSARSAHAPSAQSWKARKASHLTSVRKARSAGSMWRSIPSMSRVVCAELVDSDVDLVRTQALQNRKRIATLQQQLGERGLVVERDRFARGTLLFDHLIEPLRPAQAVLGCRCAGRLEVVGALPVVLALPSSSSSTSRSPIRLRG